MRAIARILDANLNRACEGLRMMEDAARFAVNHASLSAELKAMRHEVTGIIHGLPLPEGTMVFSRDAGADVGAPKGGSPQVARERLVEVVGAAAARAGQALRVLEETARMIDARAAGHLESIRYRIYAADQALQVALGSGRATVLRLCVILTREVCHRPWQDVLDAALINGADCIQVREKAMTDQALVAHVREVVRVARPRGLAVIVNDRPDIAVLAGADGVHLGTNDLSIADVRRVVGRDLLVGASTHNLEEAAAAVIAGADYCGVGAMFATELKPEREPSGPEYLRAFMSRYSEVPFFAIGGLTAESVARLRERVAEFPGAVGGVAVCSAVCGAADPGAAVRELLAALTVEKQVA